MLLALPVRETRLIDGCTLLEDEYELTTMREGMTAMRERVAEYDCRHTFFETLYNRSCSHH